MTDTDKLRKEYRDKTGSTWNMTHEWYSQWLEKQLLEARTKLKNNGDLGGVVGRSEQLLAFGWYIMEHSNVNDGKTAKDYLEDFLSQ